MNKPISGSGDNLDSAAILNLMLEALATASAELDKTVNILSEQLADFNQGLDKSLSDELESARQRMESALRQNQEGLSNDKESILRSLSEVKQAEIEKIVLSGKKVRTALSAHVEEAGRSLSATVAGKIASIKEHLSEPEAQIKSRYDDIQQALQSSVSEAQEQLAQARVVDENALFAATREFHDKGDEALNSGQQSLGGDLAQKRSALEAESENVVSELSKKYDEIIERLEYSYQEGLTSLNENNQQAAGRLNQLQDSSNHCFSEQEKTFQQELNETSALLRGLYEGRLNNLAAQSRNEIISAAQHAEEYLSSTRSELHDCLTEFQKDYAAQFEALRTRLEKTLEDYARKKDSSVIRGFKEERIREHLQSLFRRLGLEMVNGAANASSVLEAEFQKSMDGFEQRIEAAKTQSCDSLSRESNLMKKEMARSFYEFERQLSELQTQIYQLEKAGRDAANFVMTIRQANLDF